MDRAFYNGEKKDRKHFFIRGEKKKRPKKIRLIPIRKKKRRDGIFVSVPSKDINKGTWNKKERMNRKRKARGANTSLRFFVVKKVKKNYDKKTRPLTFPICLDSTRKAFFYGISPTAERKSDARIRT